MANQLKQRYDIIINGGGIVGFTLLNLILKSPHLNRCKVLLVEQASKPVSFEQTSRHEEASSNSQNSEWNQPDLNRYSEKRFSNRVSSITQVSKRAFKDLGVWDDIKQYSKDVKSIKVWNYQFANKIVFNQDETSSLFDYDDGIMFSVVENNRLSSALLNNIYRQENATDVIKWQYTLNHLGPSSKQDGLVDFIAENKQTGVELITSAPLVLGCDGYKSKVRDLTQMKTISYDNNMSAVVGTVRMVHSSKKKSNENDVAYQRFSNEKQAIAALLPLDREYSSFVISTTNEYSRELLNFDDETFITEFNKLLLKNESPKNVILQSIHDASNLICERLFNLSPNLNNELDQQDMVDYEEPPQLESVVQNSRASFPLKYCCTRDVIQSLPSRKHAQLALLGDSSHRIHPLAGQGLNLGIQDALELVKQLEFVAKSGERVFNENDLESLDRALKRYQIQRQIHFVPLTAGMVALPSLFNLTPSKLLSVVNKNRSIKSKFIRVANGLNL